VTIIGVTSIASSAAIIWRPSKKPISGMTTFRLEPTPSW